LFNNAATYISGEDANVEEALDDWTQIVNGLATGDTDRAVFCTCDHIKRYASRMKQGIAKKNKG
jgi:DNA-binding FadR family transcriptional regulator